MAEPAQDTSRGAAITFDGVGKTFAGGATALHDATLHVEPGAICGIIGRSGAGKSTLLRMVNGLERPTSGTVTVGGRDVGAARGGDLRAIRRQVGMIFQHFNLLASRSVAGNIALPLEIAGVPDGEIRPRVAELIEQVGLNALADRYPAQLSGGQKQRVGIARALATRPRVLLSDEATSALDPETTQTVLALLREINRDLGLTILLITHEMAVVRDIASHVAVIDGGRIVESGPTYDVFVRPQHATTQSFLSAVTGIRLPEFIASRMLPDRPATGGEEIIRVTFAGVHATDPMLARLTGQMGIGVNILAGAIEEIGPHPFGNLLIAVDAARAPEARGFLEQHGLLTEVLGYVG
ncbi:MAG: ATP-binding cassette domain-containing protein [Paracoccus sp. (in: a-proteobacteria)]|uniref:methionine ABC transporter ATP-binding protein n=1 Tax=Paracoccus sp. TaxID=267 RepID=UPI0026E0CB37|nr:ATP-binding cassette domain-containing protein [Paracoccus sp. (in: a-proteobacteria)]MDO5611990.1 ATP-binding cassette domain-containing protein [Paracoccus sp. (in: a-proteobacteria)]MDO5630629.1 ATP-binding cassette domain-containing protein [Paracoccus sp. (in: a-proteobacteria)]